MGTELRVLIVADSDPLTASLVKVLCDGDFAPVFWRVSSAEDLRATLSAHAWDIILCDDAFTGLGPATALDILTDQGMEVPIIVISGSHGLEPYVSMVKRGVGDFVGVNELPRLGPSVHRALEEHETRRQKRNLEEELRRQAAHDPLTGLPNRRLFDDRLSQSLKRAHRENGTFSLLFVDLDHFKKINDRLGHGAGDRLLCDMAHRLQKSVRDSDTVVRLAGDEFMVLLENTKGHPSGEQLARKILFALETPFDLETQRIRVTASIGIANYPANGTDARVLMDHADTAMYQVKSHGRNGYKIFGEGQEREAPSRLRPFPPFRTAAWALGVPALAAVLLVAWVALSPRLDTETPAGASPVAVLDEWDAELNMETAAGPDSEPAGR